MADRRTLRTLGAALVTTIAIAACGGGHSGPKPPSKLDPATMVPASALAYASVTFRPQGHERTNLIEAIDSIAGRGTANRLGAKIDRSLGKQDWRQMKRWLGQRVGIAITGLPARLSGTASLDSYALVVAPTNDPAAAKQWLRKHQKSLSASWKVVGHYALIGGSNALGQAQAVTAKSSLAADAGFRSDMAQLGDGEIFTAYLPLHDLLHALLPLLKSNPSLQASAFAHAERQAPPGSSVALGAATGHNRFDLDVVTHGTPSAGRPPSGVPTDVGSLPGSSWLAVTLGGALANGSTVSKLSSSLSKDLAAIRSVTGQVGSSVPSGPLRFVEQDLLPALGPMFLSVSGTSSTTLRAGLVIAPDNRSAGARLASAVRHLVSGLPISASVVGGRVAVTFGYSNLQQLLNPSSKLAANPSFKRALAQLPAGSRAQVYLNFAPITALASLDQGSTSPGTMRVLRRLDYLIAGGTHSHFRLVLATH